jgi:hypothetical protein
MGRKFGERRGCWRVRGISVGRGIRKGADFGISAPFQTGPLRFSAFYSIHNFRKGADFAVFAPFWIGHPCHNAIYGIHYFRKGADLAFSAPFWIGAECLSLSSGGSGKLFKASSMRCGPQGVVESMDSRQALLEMSRRESYGSSGLWNAAFIDDGLKVEPARETLHKLLPHERQKEAEETRRNPVRKTG